MGNTPCASSETSPNSGNWILNSTGVKSANFRIIIKPWWFSIFCSLPIFWDLYLFRCGLRGSNTPPALCCRHPFSPGEEECPVWKAHGHECRSSPGDDTSSPGQWRLSYGGKKCRDKPGSNQGGSVSHRGKQIGVGLGAHGFKRCLCHGHVVRPWKKKNQSLHSNSLTVKQKSCWTVFLTKGHFNQRWLSGGHRILDLFLPLLI